MKKISARPLVMLNLLDEDNTDDMRRPQFIESNDKPFVSVQSANDIISDKKKAIKSSTMLEKKNIIVSNDDKVFDYLFLFILNCIMKSIEY